MEKIQANSHYNPPVADPLDPVTFVHKINVPTFMACQWEDEQTGGHCPDLAQHFTGTKRKWFTFTNGAHVDSLDPYTFDRWYDFLELYVAHQAPIVNQAVIRAAAPVDLSGGDGAPEERPRHAAAGPDPDRADLRIGAAGLRSAAGDPRAVRQRRRPRRRAATTAGDPYPGFEQSFSKFPIPGTKARFWYLGRGRRAATTSRRARRGINRTPRTRRRRR